VLNCPEPTIVHNFFQDSENITHIKINMSDIRSDKVSKAIQRLKNEKSLGLDETNAELLKCREHLITEILTELCN